LYDLSKDLEETKDLATRLPGKVKELEAMLVDYIEKVDANVTGEL
tara:strand:- start:231 stop:365 length:135 start_codon:yes stop_codon:yes gene_type:complete